MVYRWQSHGLSISFVLMCEAGLKQLSWQERMLQPFTKQQPKYLDSIARLISPIPAMPEQTTGIDLLLLSEELLLLIWPCH